MLRRSTRVGYETSDDSNLAGDISSSSNNDTGLRKRIASFGRSLTNAAVEHELEVKKKDKIVEESSRTSSSISKNSLNQDVMNVSHREKTPKSPEFSYNSPRFSRESSPKQKEEETGYKKGMQRMINQQQRSSTDIAKERSNDYSSSMNDARLRSGFVDSEVEAPKVS